MHSETSKRSQSLPAPSCEFNRRKAARTAGWALALCAALAAAGCSAAPASAELQPRKLDLTRRWVYVQANLQTDENVAATLALLERAAKDGYNGIVLADGNFMRWDTAPAECFVNARKVRDACRRLGLEFIPCVFPIGYSRGMLAIDPNLAEGLPVADAPFVVRDGKLVPADDSARILNGGFEESQANAPTGWRSVSQPGKISFIDTDVRCEGKASLRMQDLAANAPESGEAAASQSLKVRPFTNYHVSVAVKTEDYARAGAVRIRVRGGEADLNFYELDIQKTQDWRRADIVFNSLEFSEVLLTIGVSEGRGARRVAPVSAPVKQGKIWFDDVRVEPAGLVNILRREGTPLRATSEDGKTVYREGRDFSPVSDPKLGVDPRPGTYTPWHEPPLVTIPAGSALKEGQKILISYYHPTINHREQVTCCMAEPKVYDILKWQAEQVRKNLAPDGYMMSQDEIRCQGWDASCAATGMTPGQILAENVKRCVGILHAADPGKPVYAWSDMFDPFHNARKTGRYYNVKGDGPWYGSWEGLPKEVIVVSWHDHERGRLESLQHFAALGNKQVLAGYYDADPARMRPWLEQAAQVEGVIGAMYTTWRNNYSDLEKYAAELGLPQ